MPSSLEFLGGAGTVTGSRAYLQADGQKILVDCGLYQGLKEHRQRNWEAFPISPSKITAVVLTHAHLDHSGYLPKLYKEGYRGPIHCTEGTAQLCGIILRDSARLQEEDAEFANKTRYSRHYPALPLYTEKDAEGALSLIQTHERRTWIQLGAEVSVRMFRAGHIVGSSFLQFAIANDHQPKLLTFSGDVGHKRSFTMREPEAVWESDVLVIESTYGDRLHPKTDVLEDLARVTQRTFARKGVLIVPAFAVGRTQEMLYLFRQLEDQGRIPKVPVLLDSPMSQSATQIFLERTEDHSDRIRELKRPEDFFPHLFEQISSVDESMMACMREGPLVVIAAAGMLTGGRILHHLKHRLPHEENTVLFVGYQAEGSKGRYLQDEGKKTGSLRIHHVDVPVAAEISTLTNLSAHADAEELVDWMRGFKRLPSRVIVNHGSPQSATALAQRIRSELGIKDVTPLGKEERFALW